MAQDPANPDQRTLPGAYDDVLDETEEGQMVRFSRPRGDDGAMAVFICLLLVLVLLPATALGLSSYTRSAVQAEKSRSADSGALAGAASLALLDVTGVPANPLQAVSKDGIAFTKACAAAKTAASVDLELSEDYAKPVGPGCFARYSPDTQFAQCADDILRALAVVPLPLVPITVPLPGTPALPGLPGVPGVVPPQPIPGLPPSVTVDPRLIARTLVPALLHNGITVTMTYTVRGPLDGVLGRDTKTHTAVSTARRRFKPLVPPGVLGANEKLVTDSLKSVLASLKQVVGTNPQGALPGVCKPAVTDVINDLEDAVEINTEGTDLLTCVQSVIARLDTSGVLANILPSVNLDCTDKLFRAQLAPNA